MRRLRYGVAMSLDGFIAGPSGEHDWMIADPAIDYAAMHARFDTYLVGRRTYEVARVRAAGWPNLGHKWVVVSSSLKPEDHPGIAILSSDIPQAVAQLKAQPGKDIWLFGGGVLFRFLLDAGLVDGIDVSVMPVMLGSGTPLVTEGRRQTLYLEESRALPSGILLLSYSIGRTPGFAGVAVEV
jgi:dihydrofolate reductase